MMFRFLVPFLAALITMPLWAQPLDRLRLEFEGGSTWQSRNDVAIPGDTGTRFSLRDFSAGPFFSYRLSFWYRFDENHSIRGLYAPFEVTVRGMPTSAIDFNGDVFSVGDELEGIYKFNSYRLAYIYSFDSKGPWRFHVGFSAKIRDARVALENSTTSNDYTNIGFVPLLLGRVEYHFSDKLWTLLDAEALGAPQGRAEDVTLQIRYKAWDPLDVGFGYRMVEGGADNAKVFTFAWLHTLLFSVAAEF